MFIVKQSPLFSRQRLPGRAWCFRRITLLAGDNDSFLHKQGNIGSLMIAGSGCALGSQKNLPQGSDLIADRYTCLGGAGDLTRHPEQPDIRGIQLIAPKYAADAEGSFRSSGRVKMAYVAVVSTAFDRFFEGSLVSGDRTCAQRHRFYKNLFEHGELLWSYNPTMDSSGYTDPEMRLYRIELSSWKPEDG